jgi:predicted methyltransferase
LAFLCDVYHHIEYPKGFLLSLRRALRPGGSVVVIDFRKVPGESSDWVMNHVRAGQDAVIREFAQYGFEKVEEQDFLNENYFLRFKRVDF